MDLDTSSSLQQLFTLRERINTLTEELAVKAGISHLKLDLLDAGDSYRVIAEVPGVSQADLEVALEGRELTIAGLRDPYAGDPHLLIAERSTGHFQRTIELPGEVLREGSQAHLREGLLILDLPKA